MKKRLIAVLCALIMVVSMTPVVSAASDPYWAWQSKWQAVKDTNNYDEIISVVNELVTSVRPHPSTASEYEQVAYPTQVCGKAYENKGMYAEALDMYQRSLWCYEWLNANGRDYSDSIKGLKALMAVDQGAFDVYTETNNPDDSIYYGAINEPKAGTYVGTCGEWQNGYASSRLLYVRMPSESIRNYETEFDKNNGEIMEVAWNFDSETKDTLDTVASGGYDDLIRSDLEFLKERNQKILLRFGAEVNVFTDLPTSDASAKAAYCESFKAAFRHVADMTHQIAPNCAMVFSPNDLSNWVYDDQDFYPGDEYVDWVGMSSYSGVASYTEGTLGSVNDAYFFTGQYTDPIMRIKDIVDTYGNRKPIMISECGFTSTSFASSSDMMREFYTYVNRVYPQVKAVFYFDNDYQSQSFSFASNPELLSVYKAAVGANVSMQATISPSGSSSYYTNLNRLNTTGNQLNLSAYAYLPTHPAETVTYYLDGQQVYSSDQYPYSYTTPALSAGSHVIQATAAYGSNSKTRIYSIYVGEDGRITGNLSNMQDVSYDDWFSEAVGYCMHYNLMMGTGSTTFSPDANTTRAMIVTLLYRLEGQPSVSAANAFSDVPAGQWYSDAITWASENGIVKGIGDGLFAPDADITREDLISIFYRYANYKQMDVSASGDISGFSDQGSIRDYSLEPIKWGVGIGLISGMPDGTIQPQGSASRAMAAMFLMRFREYYK
ncbi:MAG: S-layer homology domain-containing protein [Anaerovoracaceae bacterium]|jgi:hypothetical protein